MERPKLKEGNIDSTHLAWVTEDYLDFIQSPDRTDDDEDYKQRIFEEAMKTIYGDNVFKWINKQK